MLLSHPGRAWAPTDAPVSQYWMAAIRFGCRQCGQ